MENIKTLSLFGKDQLDQPQRAIIYMQSNGSKQQLFQRDDIIQLGSRLQQQSFNVMAHKRLKKSKPIVTQNSHPFVQTIKTLQMQTIQGTGQSYLKMDSESKVIEQDRAIPRKGRMNTSNSYFRSNSRAKNNLKDKIRFNQTITVKSQSLNESDIGSEHTNKKSLPFNDFGQSGDKMNLSKIIEKQFNRGPLKQRHLMNWLNQIIVEYCFSSDFEKGELKALQRFGLDQNTLLSKGINGAQITRLYKSLFVYSIGFNNLLKDISNNSKSVKKSIWKTYVVLLEYCSQGNFQTTMGELQRDMIKNEQRLIKQIEIRQAQIDNNQEIMEGRLHKYIKENKELTLIVKTLQEKNQVLEKQFREMEVAYNMEVTLRLAYQYKINEIYSVHEKLNILHLNLYKDFQEKSQQNKKLDRQCWTAKQGASELKAYNQQILGCLSDLQHQLQLSDNMLEGLKLNEKQLNEKIYEQTRQKRNQVVQLRQKQKKIVQLQRTLGSSNLIVDMMKSTSNSHYEQYKRLMMQNSDLRRVKEGQVQKIQELLDDVKYLNSKESSLKNQIQHAQHKIAQLYQKIKHLQDDIEKLTKKYDEKQIQFRTKCVELDGQLKLSTSLQNSNKQTKLVLERLQDQNKTLTKYSEEINGRFKKTHQDLLVLQLQNKVLQQEKFELELEINRRVNDIINLKKKYQSENSMQANHFEKLHKMWSEQEGMQQALSIDLQNAKKQLQAANLRICFLSQQFTDLSFQKSKIQGLYKDNLILHDRQKRAEKDLMIQMSKMTEQIERCNRQMEVNNKTSQQNINKITKQKQQIEKQLAATRQALRKKQGFVHPMLLQDALQTLQREIENHYSSRISLQNQIQKEKQTISSLNIELQKKENSFRHNVMQLQKRVQKMQDQLKGQRQYFQQKSVKLNKLVYELETKLNEKTIQAERAENNSAENKFLNLMKQKNSQIQQLLSELQRIEDNYTEKCSNYENEIQHIQRQRENVITELKESKKQLQVKVIQIEKTYQQKLIEKQKEKEQIIQQLLEQKHFTENDNDQNEQNVDKNQNKRTDFIRRLKFANLYYKK